MTRSLTSKSVLAIATAAASFALPAAAQVLDNFDAPTPGWLRTATGAPGSAASLVRVCEAGLPVPGGARDVTHNVYNNPLGSVSAVAVGEGRLSVAQGTGLMAETIVSYGAFTRVGCDDTVGGPRLRLNLSAVRSLRLTFSGAEDNMNVNVVYYTSAPLDPRAPLYYATVSRNVAPGAPGAPLEFKLPVGENTAFNWKQVDGVVVLINRSGPIPHTSYTLDQLSFGVEP